MPAKNKTKKTAAKPFYRKKLFIWGAAVVVVVAAILLAFRVSPWPGALVIRVVFNQGGGDTLKAMQEKLPNYPNVAMLKDQAYRQHDTDARLDVYIPKSARADQPLPIVVWTHGGAWLSGDKKDAGPYFNRLADQGFVVVSVNYSLAPEKTYPTAVHQLNDAHAYIQAHAAEYKGDPRKIVLAGDSAGAQLSSQLAALATNPAYAKEVGIQPALKPEQLAGVMLFCGIYRMEGLATPDPTLPKLVGWGDNVAVWAYSGSSDMSNPLIRQMSAYYHVSQDFPDTFITGGNGDPLTEAQSKPFAEKLSSLNVAVTPLFYPKDHTPSLPHEYQFTFNNDGEKAFEQTVRFLQATTK